MNNQPVDPSVAEEAIKLVTSDRQAMYGHPYENFMDTAKLWSVILGIKVKPEQVALCLMQVKVARELHASKRDNIVDAIGYLLTYDATNRTAETKCGCNLVGCIECEIEII